MKPTKCSFCEGNLQKGKTEFVARVENEVIVIKEVPAYVCEQCGEAYYTPEISRKIDEVMREFHGGKLLVRPLAAGEVELKLEA
jgi:YgiT-type zinc finger domain-containing protein